MENNWINQELYPFKSHFFELPSGGKMHYVDEGEGEVILFVHGTPTWSFLYREFIKALSTNYRCIAIDHLGFGLSDKSPSFNGNVEAHVQHLSTLIQKLDLKEVTLVVHDFGGPIGLGAALQDPTRIKRIVAFNTWLWETASNPAVRKVGKLLDSWLGKWMYLRLNFSPKVLLKQAFKNKSKLPGFVHQQYILPFPDKDSRWGLLNIGKQLLGASDWYELQKEALPRLKHIPWLFIWGTDDPFITPSFLDRWKELIPHAEVVELPVGHFVQEEAVEEAIDAVKKFL